MAGFSCSQLVVDYVCKEILWYISYKAYKDNESMVLC